VVGKSKRGKKKYQRARKYRSKEARIRALLEKELKNKKKARELARKISKV